MQLQDEHPPGLLPPSQHRISDNNIPTMHPPSRGPPPRETLTSGLSGAPMPLHMTHACTGYAQEPQLRSYHTATGTPSVPTDYFVSSAEPLPPHMTQHMVPPHARGDPTVHAAARSRSVPEHLKPRPFPQQRDISPRRQQQMQQHTERVQGMQQQPAQALQPMASCPPPLQAPLAGTEKPVSAEPVSGASASRRLAQAIGSESAYQTQTNYVGSSTHVATVIPMDKATDAAGAPQTGSPSHRGGWYHGSPMQHAVGQKSPEGHFLAQQPRNQCPQQHPSYETDAQQARSHLPGPGCQPNLPRQSHLPKQSQQQQAQLQFSQRPQEYQQHHYSQKHNSIAPLVADEGNGGQVRRAPSVSGQASMPSAPTPPLHTVGSTNGAAPSVPQPAAEAPEHPSGGPPIKLKPAAIDTTATPVSFVQLVQQPGGIQIDQSGAVRVVPLEGATGPGQPITSSVQRQQQNAAYGPPQRRPPVHDVQPPQRQQYGSTGATPTVPLPGSLHMTKEPATVSQHVYDQQSYGQHAGAPVGGAGDGGSKSWEDPVLYHNAAVYAQSQAPLMGAGDGSAYMPTAERARSAPPPQAAPQVQPVPRDVGYMYGGSPHGHFTSGDMAPDLNRMASAGCATGPATWIVSPERPGLKNEPAVSEVHRRQTTGSVAPASCTARPMAAPSAQVAEEAPLPLPEAMKRAEALLAAVAATQIDGELMTGMRPQLVQTCEKRMNDLMLALKVAAAEANAARVEAVAASAEVTKATADAADSEGEDTLGSVGAREYAFLLGRSIRTVWPLETPEHQLYRVVAEVLLIESDGGRCVPVNNEEVRLRAHEMVGATLCNVGAVVEKAAKVKAMGGSSTMSLIRQECAYFEVKEHINKQHRTSIQWLVRLRVEKLPSYGDVRRALRTAINMVLPAAPDKPQPQQKRQTTGHGSNNNGADHGGCEGAGPGCPNLQFLSREPEGAERSVLRHVALHLLGCKTQETGLFHDKLEAAAEAVPPHLVKLYGKTRLQDLKQVLKLHPFFSLYCSGTEDEAMEFIVLNTGVLLQLQYRARLVLQQEQQEQDQQQISHQSKRRRLSGEGADELEQWWMNLRSRRS
ncbi:hypothetical protein Vretimale_7901 [Volvox reticuliferus]|uniref:Uncharacterized protein n=1 Tax=Volvox reticuliferus TaxID=1737510 RepID=A0A8J4C5R8_9CHLO|nr:hypothetical protein Vretifemale_5046 [Volvox reticuliferus]GIM03102.1 hypothetical protein Vretimale_7901 [Volvox reticuliferus]